MPASNPLTAIDLIIVDQLRYFTALTTIVNANMIQVWDREVDLRDDPEEQQDAGPRVWLVPVRTDPKIDYSSSSARIELIYNIGYGTGRITVESSRLIEWVLIRLAARLYKGIGPTGVALDPNTAAPLLIEKFLTGPCNPDREPLDAPQEWQGVFELRVVAMAAHAALVA